VKNYIAKLLTNYIEFSEEELYSLLETPPQRELGDVAFPCFTLAKQLKKGPQIIAKDLANLITDNLVRIEANGPYLNFFFHRVKFAEELVEKIIFAAKPYGETDLNKGKTVVIDFSSPNIAKPFSMGHLRSTVIGNALKNVYRALGYNVIGINHLGDWGTQFGKLIAAYKKWGDEEKVAIDPINELLKLYVRFHEEAEHNQSLEDEGRKWFKRLEDGDKEALNLWQYFVKVSLAEFDQIYQTLGIKFQQFDANHIIENANYYLGESFYNDKMEQVVEELANIGLLQESEGAKIVDLSDHALPPVLIKKKDGATIYATRDLASLLFRKKTFDFVKALYVVGAEQSLHFQQVFTTIKKMGYEWAEVLEHVPFGLLKLEGKKMSTRKGTVVFLKEVLEEAKQAALEIIEEKNPNLPDKENVAEKIGVGAIVFNDLKHYRIHEVNFSWEEAFSFEGETGPYLFYTYARTQSLLRKSELAKEDLRNINGSYLQISEAWELMVLLNKYQDILFKTAQRNEPHILARYLLDIAQHFNSFYHAERINVDNIEEKQAKLAIVYALGTVLKHGLELLGLQPPEAI